MDPLNVNNVSHMTDNQLITALARYGEMVESVTTENRLVYCK